MSAPELTLAELAAFVARHAYHAPRCRPDDADDPLCVCGMTALRERVLRPKPPVYHDCTCAYPCGGCPPVLLSAGRQS